MKTAEHPLNLTPACNGIETRWPGRSVKPSFLHLVTGFELDDLNQAMGRTTLPSDLAAKLKSLSGEDITRQFIEQNCRLFIALLLAASQGRFKGATSSERERLLRVLAYVRKDDDHTPDYCRNGFDDDRQEVRAALTDLDPLLQDFKAWRLRHQVSQMWPSPSKDIAVQLGGPSYTRP